MWVRTSACTVKGSLTHVIRRLKHNRMVLQIRPGASDLKKQAVLDEWYRAQLKEAAPPLVAKWERLMGVNV